MSELRIPKLETPREVAVAALAGLIHGDSADEAIEFLQDGGVFASIKAGATASTAFVRLSPRRSAQATAGCRIGALAHALHDALAGKEQKEG